jgi:hypothetical protein
MNIDQSKLNASLKELCLESYNKDAQYFQIVLKGLGTGVWNLQGQIRFIADVIRRNARARLRD